jgi:hypothetical protein
MPLNFMTVPETGRHILRDAIRGIQKTHQQGTHLDALCQADAEAIQIGAPHPVYELHLNELAENGCIEQAHPNGIRYLVKAGSSLLAAGEIGLEEGSEPIFKLINAGDYVAGTGKALEHAHELSGAYEPRLLRCSALYVLALWLKSSHSSHHDRVIPIAPAPDFLQEPSYAVKDFFAALKPKAQEAMKHFGAPQTSPSLKDNFD